MDIESITVVDTKGVVTLQTYIQVIKHRGHDGFIASCPQSLIKSRNSSGKSEVTSNLCLSRRLIKVNAQFQMLKLVLELNVKTGRRVLGSK